MARTFATRARRFCFTAHKIRAMIRSKPFSLLLRGLLLLLTFAGGVAYWRAKSEVHNTRSRSSSRAATQTPAQLDLVLIEAVKKKQTPQVTALIARGANPNARDNSAFKRWKKRLAAEVSKFDPPARIQAHNQFLGPTVLMIAAYQGDNATLKTLIDAGANVNAQGIEFAAASATGSESYDLETRVTPLIEAMMSGEPRTMRLLLSKGADVNAKTSEGLTALDTAYNMTPTSRPIPAEVQRFLDKIFSVLKEVKAKPSSELR